MDPSTFTSLNDIEKVTILVVRLNYHVAPDTYFQAHATVKAGFRSGKTRPVAFRKKMLARLAYMLQVSIKHVVCIVNQFCRTTRTP